MDKDTLSAYGWILIATIAIGVFIALSQLIGQYVGEVVTGVGQGMVDVGDSVNEDKLDNDMNDLFEDNDEDIHIEITD